jgi:hypothetical protein
MQEPMNDPEAERQRREQAVRFLLYPVIFSPDLALEPGRVAELFRTHQTDQLTSIVRDTRAELARPLLQVSQVEDLVSKSTESQVRAYLTAVSNLIEGEYLSRGVA